MIWARIFSIGLFVTAGVSLTVLALNRTLHLIKERPGKLPVALCVTVGVSFACVLLALRFGSTAWRWIPTLLLAGILAMEVRRLLLRRRYRVDGDDVSAFSIWKPITTLAVTVPHYRVELPGWPSMPLRAVHLSDLHFSDLLPFGFFVDVMHRAAALEPDLVLITGDFVEHVRYCDKLLELLSMVRGKLGTFAVLGNHDHWRGREEIARTVTAAGITLLGNAWRRLPLAGGAITISGCEDPWNDEPWTPPPREDSSPLLVLTHTADNTFRLIDRGADVILAGHYHGGQASVPGFGSILAPSKYGRVFDRGHFLVGNTHLIVSSGIGAGKPPIRVYCPPEVIAVDLSRPGDGQFRQLS